MKKLVITIILSSLLVCSLMLTTGSIANYSDNNTQLAEYLIINPPPA